MTKGVNLAIAADARSATSAIKRGVLEPLEDVSEALEQLGDVSDDATQQLERGMRDAQRRTDDAADEIKDLRDELNRAGRAARNVGDDGAAGLGRVKNGAQEVQQEIGQNMGQAVSAFRGDLQDLGQVGQDTLGGLAASIASTGPAGILGAIVLAAGAAGLGLFTAGLEESKEKQEALNASAAEWADKYVESAGRIVSATDIVAEIQAIATDPERYKQAKDNARDWGVGVADAMRAMAGDADALGIVQEGLNRKQEEWGRILEETSASGGSYERSTMTDAQRELGVELERGTEALKLQSDAMRLGQEQAQNAASALYDYATKAGTATGETDDLGNAIVDLPGGKQIVIDANTRRAYEDIDALERRQLAPKTAIVKLQVDDRGWKDWRPPDKSGTVKARVDRSDWE